MSITAINSITAKNSITATAATKNEPAIDRALSVLTDAGISFEVVTRCPSECTFCDGALPHAA